MPQTILHFGSVMEAHALLQCEDGGGGEDVGCEVGKAVGSEEEGKDVAPVGVDVCGEVGVDCGDGGGGEDGVVDDGV